MSKIQAKEVIIFGIGDFSELVYYYLSKDPSYKVVAFTVDKKYISERTYLDLPLVPFEDIEKLYSPEVYFMFVALGYSKVNKLREEKYLQAENKGYKFFSYVSNKATLFDNVQIGKNCFIFEDNTLQPYSKIGNNTILWSGNHIGHHSSIGQHCFISSHVVIAGRVSIANNTFIGINSTIRDHVCIGKSNIIGAGAIILKDTNDYSVISPKQTEISKIPSTRLRDI